MSASSVTWIATAVTMNSQTSALRFICLSDSTRSLASFQQCDFSLCTTFDTTTSEWRFGSQDNGFRSLKRLTGKLWKFAIPSTEREKVLGLLDSMNLNAYSLFGDEESLMDTVALRALELGTVSSLKKKTRPTRS